MGQVGTTFWLQFPQWVRGPAKIDGKEIVLDEDRVEEYFIHEPTDLLPDLAGLAEFLDSRSKGEKLAVTFARRHGLLWHGPDKVGSGECREQLEKWIYAAIRIRIVALLYVRLLDSMQSGSIAPLRELQKELKWDWTTLFKDKPATDWEYLSYASTAVAQMVNEGLGDCSNMIVAACAIEDPEDPDSPLGDPGVFITDVRPKTLEATAYAHFSQQIEHQVPLSECPGCGRPFLPKSGKQQYCSESCASTARWRRWKGKKAETA